MKSNRKSSMKSINTRQYRSLSAGMRFTVDGQEGAFVKLSDSQALNIDTGKDAIFRLTERCVPRGLQRGYYPLWNLL